MATILGAGKYVFGVDIPEGKYTIKATSGRGMLKIQISNKPNLEEWMLFGVFKDCTKTYYGLSLPRGWYFEVTDNVVFEITKSIAIKVD